MTLGSRPKAAPLTLLLGLLGCASFGATLWLERARDANPFVAVTPAPAESPSAAPSATPGTTAADADAATATVTATASASATAVAAPAALAGDELQRVLRDVSGADSAARGTALNALRRAEVEVAAPVLGRVLAQDPEPAVRHGALEVLAQLRDDPRWHDAADNTLRSRLDDGNEELAARIQERLDRETPVRD